MSNQPAYPPGCNGPPEPPELAEVSKEFRPTITAVIKITLVFGAEWTVVVPEPITITVPVSDGFIKEAVEQFWRHHEERHWPRLTTIDIERWVDEDYMGYMTDADFMSEYIEAQTQDHDGYTITHIISIT